MNGKTQKYNNMELVAKLEVVLGVVMVAYSFSNPVGIITKLVLRYYGVEMMLAGIGTVQKIRSTRKANRVTVRIPVTIIAE